MPTAAESGHSAAQETQSIGGSNGDKTQRVPGPHGGRQRHRHDAGVSVGLWGAGCNRHHNRNTRESVHGLVRRRPADGGTGDGGADGKRCRRGRPLFPAPAKQQADARRRYRLQRQFGDRAGCGPEGRDRRADRLCLHRGFDAGFDAGGGAHGFGDCLGRTGGAASVVYAQGVGRSVHDRTAVERSGH